jgi:hypothetical protein
MGYNIIKFLPLLQTKEFITLHADDRQKNYSANLHDIHNSFALIFMFIKA